MSRHTLIQDRDGNASSKRLAGFVALTCFVLGFLSALSGGHTPPEWMFTDLMGIILGCFGLAAAEWFAPKKAPDVRAS